MKEENFPDHPKVKSLTNMHEQDTAQYENKNLNDSEDSYRQVLH